MKRSNIRFIIFLLMNQMCVADIGSDFMVDRFNTQQVLNGDRIAGFAALDGGFRLIGSNATGIFDSFFQVSGEIALNFGTLTLNQDLIMSNVSSLRTLGDIVGNSHVLDLSKTASCIPSSSDQEFGCGVTFVLNESQSDDVESVDWSYDNQYLAVGLDFGLFSPIFKIYEFDGTTVTDVYSANISINLAEVTTVRWHPSQYLIAVTRLQTIGAELFILSFDPSQPIEANRITITDSVNTGQSFVAAEWRPDGDYLATIEAGIDRLSVYPVDGSGNLGTPFQITVAGNVTTSTTQVLSWDPTGTYLVLGTTSSAELQVYEFDPSDTGNELTLNASSNPNSDVFAVSWNQVYGSIIAVGFQNDDLRLYEHNGGAGTLIQVGTPIDTGNDVRSLHWAPSGICLAMGKNDGGGDEFRTYDYNPSDNSLSQVSAFAFSEDVETVRWNRNGSFIANGSDDHCFSIYKANSSFIDYGYPECVLFTDLCVYLNCNVTLKNCCIKFSGQSSIVGRGNCLTLSPDCRILVDADSSLLLKDITIKGINDERIQGCDSTSTFSLQDITWVQNGDYTFGLGHFEALKDFDIVGDGYEFSYESDQISTIEKCGCMNIHQGLTFKYNPGGVDQDRIQLTDPTSKLALCGGTLSVMAPGLSLTKGQFVVKNRSFICAQEYGSLTLGDGYDYTNNLNVQIFPAANLEITKGCVLYNNV